jgi:hypothetical protein
MNCLENKMQNFKPGLTQYFVSNFIDDKKDQIIIKRHKNRNEYFKVDNYWVRNFGKEHVEIRDLNNFYEDTEYKQLISNEVNNAKLDFANISSENFTFENIVVVSDGFNFDEHQETIVELPTGTCIITVNQALRLWKSSAYPEYYLICNTSDSAMSVLPNKIFPKLFASRRTYGNFVKRYKNIGYFYDPVPDFTYQSPFSKESALLIDDYRNPICAALGIAFNLRVSRIFLAYCSHAYKEHRDGTQKIGEGIFQYPQQKLADKIVDANIFWYSVNMPEVEIYHTGIINSFRYAKYLEKDLFKEMILS